MAVGHGGEPAVADGGGGGGGARYGWFFGVDIVDMGGMQAAPMFFKGQKNMVRQRSCF
eukprot:SAG22_NODE_4239_length_1330_cov_3.306255_2_plen_58_part_00